MIFLEDNRAKTSLLIFVVIIIAGIFFWQYLKSEPLSEIDAGQDEVSILALIEEKARDSFNNLKLNLEVDKLEMAAWQKELQRQIKQEALVEETKNFLETVATSTESN